MEKKISNWKIGILFIITLLLFTSVTYALDLVTTDGDLPGPENNIYVSDGGSADLFSITLFGSRDIKIGQSVLFTVTEYAEKACTDARLNVNIFDPKDNFIKNVEIKRGSVAKGGFLSTSFRYYPTKQEYGKWAIGSYLKCTSPNEVITEGIGSVNFFNLNQGDLICKVGIDYNAKYCSADKKRVLAPKITGPGTVSCKSEFAIIDECTGEETCQYNQCKTCASGTVRDSNGVCVQKEEVKEEEQDDGIIRGNVPSISWQTLKTYSTDILRKPNIDFEPSFCDIDNQCKDSDAACIVKSVLESAKAGQPFFGSLTVPTQNEQILLFNVTFDRSNLNSMIDQLAVGGSKGFCVNDWSSSKVDESGQPTPNSKSITLDEDELDDAPAQSFRDAACSSRFDCAKVDDDTKTVKCLDTPEIRGLIEDKTSAKVSDFFGGIINRFKKDEPPSGICVAVSKEESDFFRSIGKIFIPNGLPDDQRKAGQIALGVGVVLLIIILKFAG